MSPAQETNTQPMNWHGFLIYFSLWISAGSNIWSAVTILLGKRYGSMTLNFYSRFPAMLTLDIVLAIACLILGAMAIGIRFSLAKFETDAPAMLFRFLMAAAACNLVNALLMMAILPSGAVNVGSTFGQIAGAVAIAGINKSYYDKRQAMFVN